MTGAVPLFEPINMRGITLANRIVVSPMCQYSAVDGVPQTWHFQHLGSMASSGPGLVVVEATAVEAIGRITPGCTGLYSDDSESVFGALVAATKAIQPVAVGIQLNHAGRKASMHPPWIARVPVKTSEGGWKTLSASNVPFSDWPTPRAATVDDLAQIKGAFVASTQRALRSGFDLIEIHSAHGYLLHQFLSPLSNTRTDEYGGSLENRMRFPLEVIRAVRAAWPTDKPMGMRVSATDRADGGWEINEAVRYVAAAKAEGVDYCCVSSGGLVLTSNVPSSLGYQVGFAERVRKETGILTRAVGMIVEPHQANAVIATGKADMVALARAFLDDPRWVWRAAEALGTLPIIPPQYSWALTSSWNETRRRAR